MEKDGQVKVLRKILMGIQNLKVNIQRVKDGMDHFQNMIWMMEKLYLMDPLLMVKKYNNLI